MKKVISFAAAFILVICAASCSDKKVEKNKSAESGQSSTGTVSSQTAVSDTKKGTTSKAQSTSAVSTTTASKTTKEATTQPDPLGGGIYEYNEDGALVFEKEVSDIDEKTLIGAAQALFESACRTEIRFTVGCPFSTDSNDYIQNNFGWKFYRITDSDINSYSDIEKAYYSVFSDRYPNKLSTLYMEEGGSVYAFSGNRGTDFYYSSSKVTGIKSRSDDEIVFTVDNYYDGSDFGEGAHTETTEFSAVIGSDNVWKAGKFTLPY